ncbi:MAG: thioredoxin [Bacteroidales bacterium]|jgi:thioredoxin 1|nr:thioredoxin [Bacteroidales bacterium]
MVLEVNDQNFAEVKQSQLPVLLDIGATWCGPCKALAPIIEEIAAEYDGRALVCKVDVDEAPGIASEFRVRNVPTVLFIKGGAAVDKSVGLVAKATLTDKLNALL